MKDWVFSTAWMAGIALAPHTLARLGNLSGTFQWFLLPLLACALLVFWLNSSSLNALHHDPSRNLGEMAL